MAKFKCKMCGAPLDVSEGQTVVTCAFCQSKQTVANADDERKENLFNRANSLRSSCDFDKAILSYQSILSIFPNEPEAHWGLCLCKYGIEYVDDPSSHKKIPTIHRMSFDSILKDSDYLAALSYADILAREEYQEEANQIANIQKNILSISQKEEPFDIFICYKETSNSGKRTPDSVLAQEIYSNLTDKGYKVFFSRITLESKLGSMYEPYIFAALNSAKIMLVIGTKTEYFEAVWVRNEWTRFIDMMKTRPDHYLIPCYKDMDAYEMPEQFLSFQGQDMGKLGFMQDLLRGIDKIMGRSEAHKVQTETKIIQTDVNVSALLKRAEILISDGNFTKADELLERVLDNDPTNSQAYLLKLLIELEFTSFEQLKTLDDTIETNGNFRKAYNFGDQQQKAKLSSINEFIVNRNEEARLGELYDSAIDLKNSKRYAEAEAAFSEISGYRDSAKQALECVNLGKEDIYLRAVELKKYEDYESAIETFEKIKEYKDSEYQISECNELIIKSKYEKAIQLKENGMFDEAISIFMDILKFQDADAQVDECERLKTEAKKEAVYSTCLFNREINPYFDVKALKKACEKLATIPGYKDANQLLTKYEGIIKDYEAELAKKREEAKRAKAKKVKKIKKISVISAVTSLVLTGVLLLTFLFLIPMGRQNKIQSLIDSGKYEDALSLIEENDNFGDTKNLESMCKAGIAFKNLDYETGIDYIYNIGGSVDVKYDNNGGNSEKGSETIKRARNYVDNNAEKSGCNFHGWLLTDYAIDSKSHYASINLEAQYNVITYNISYTLNGGSSSTQLPTTYTTEKTISIPNPTKEGYTFLGWTGLDVPTPTVDYVIPVGSIGNKSYIANWKANEYTIYLNPNGGTVSQQEVKATYDSVYSLPTPNYNGYDFKGWFDSSSTKYSGGTYKVPSDLYLNASWEAHNYTISYNLNGGINDSRNPSSYKIVDSDIILRDPTRTGYTFIGWTCSQISIPTKGVKIESGTTGNLYFEANWQANTYNVTIDLNGGESDKASYSFVYDLTYSIVNPTRVGYSFEKFTYNGETVLPSSGTWKIAEDITIKANWIANSDTPYIINYYTENLNGDGYTKVYAETSYGYSDKSVTLTAKTYEGFTPIKSSQTVTIAANGSTVVDFYYRRNSYTISFVTNGGSSIDSETYKYEEQIPSTLKAIRAGYTFAGWYTDEKQTTLFDKMPASNQMVYAYYSEETKASFFTYTFSGQEVTITKGNGLSGSVVVPEYIAGKLVTAIGDNAFENCSAVTEITLSDSVDELGSSAFKGCSSLVRINGTSNLSAIKDSTFEGCSALAYFPDLSNVTSIGNNAFKGCSSLTTFTISDSLTSIGNYAFENCVMLLQTPDLTNVTSIGDYAFKGCTLLSEIKSLDGCATFGEGIFTACENIAKIILSFKENIEQFYVSSFFKGSADSSKYYGVTGKNDSIYYIPKRLTEIEYDTTGKTPDYFLYGLTSITKVTDKSDSTTKIGKHAFDGCTNLTDYSIQNSVVSLVDEYAFQNCTSLTDLPEFQLEEVKKYAFANCSALLAAPDIENTSYIGDYAFSGCSLITSIKNSNASYFGVNSLYGCSALEELEVPFVGTSINSTEAFGVIFGTTSYSNSYETTQLSETYYIPNGLAKLIIGGSYISAYSCVNLTSITDLIVSDSVETIGDYAFEGMISLERMTVPYISTSYGLGRFFGRYFDYNGYLPSGMIATTSYLVNNDSSYRYVYYIPASLREVSVTVATSIPEKAFYNCSNLTDIHISESLSEIKSYAFYGCSSLKSVNSSVDGVFNIPTGVIELKEYAFYGCSSIEVFSIGNGVSSIGNHAFDGCILMSRFNSESESTIEVPESCTFIGYYAFNNAGLITDLIVSDSVETIGDYAFEGMISLERMTVPYISTSYGLGRFFGRYFDYNGYLPSGMIATTSYLVNNDSSYRYVYYIPASLREVSVTVATSIPEKAFYNCSNLTDIHLLNSVQSIGEKAFDNCPANIDYSLVPTRSSAWDGTSIANAYHNGLGTEQEPFVIFSAEEFIYFLTQIREGESYENVYFVLTSNINLGGYSINATALTEDTSFKGILDGNSHKIYNFIITSPDNSFGGLFGYVDGIIRNIGFETSMMITTNKTTDVYVGLVVGKLNGSLENVYVTGTLTSTSLKISYVGGLVGYNGGSISNSYANVNVTTVSTNLKCYAAGLVGFNNGIITGSFAYGNVSAKGYAESYSYASGLVASEGSNSSVISCYRYNGQTIIKFGSSSTSYNEIGIVASLEEIISYCKANWNGDVWSFKNMFPTF